MLHTGPSPLCSTVSRWPNQPFSRSTSAPARPPLTNARVERRPNWGSSASARIGRRKSNRYCSDECSEVMATWPSIPALPTVSPLVSNTTSCTAAECRWSARSSVPSVRRTKIAPECMPTASRSDATARALIESWARMSATLPWRISYLNTGSDIDADEVVRSDVDASPSEPSTSRASGSSSALRVSASGPSVETGSDRPAAPGALAGGCSAFVPSAPTTARSLSSSVSFCWSAPSCSVGSALWTEVSRGSIDTSCTASGSAVGSTTGSGGIVLAGVLCSAGAATLLACSSDPCAGALFSGRASGAGSEPAEAKRGSALEACRCSRLDGPPRVAPRERPFFPLPILKAGPCWTWPLTGPDTGGPPLGQRVAGADPNGPGAAPTEPDAGLGTAWRRTRAVPTQPCVLT